MVLGQMFVPLVKRVVPFINGLTIGLKSLMASIAGMFGLKLEMSEYGQGYTEIEDGAEDATDAIEDMTEATKKLKSATLGIDELNINNPQGDTESESGVGGGLDLTDEIVKATEEYEKKWQEAFDNMENLAEKWAKRIEKSIEPIKKLFQDISVGDWFAVGEDVSGLVSGIFNFFSRAIDNVDWYAVGQKIGSALAGINWTEVLMSVGKAIVKALGAVLKIAMGMFDTAPLTTALISLVAVPKILKLITGGAIVSKVTKLGKAFGVLGTSFSVFMAGIKDKQALLGFRLGIQNIRSHLGLMQKSLIGVVSVLGEFFAVKDGFYNLAMGAENVAASIGKIVAGAGLASAALYTAFGPAGLVVAGIVGLTGALVGANKALEDKRNIEAYGQSLETLVEKINNSSQAISQRMEESQKFVNEAGVAETTMARDLADRYFDLFEKQELTNEEKEEMIRLSDLLVESIPGLEQYYNSETGLIDATRESVENLIDARLREIQIAAAEDKLKEAYKERLEATNVLDEALSAVEITQGKINALQEEYNGYSEKLDLVNKYFALQTEIQKTGDATGELREELALLYDEITEGGTKPKYIDASYWQQNMYDVFVEIEKFRVDYEKEMEALSNATIAFEDVQETIQKYTDYIVSGMTQASKDSTSGYAEGLNNDTETAEASYNLARKIIDAFAEGQDSHSPSKEFESLAKDSVDGYNLGVIKNEKSTIAIISDYVSKIKEKVFDMQDLIVKSFSESFIGLAEVVRSSFNSILDGLEFTINHSFNAISNMVNSLNQIQGVNLKFNAPPVDIPEIPHLAKGMVISPNDPFVAMLGDQSQGRNIEAPESLIRQIVREETSGSIEMIELLTQIVTNTRETADKDFNVNIGDRDIYKANLRGARASGRPVIV